MQESFYPAWARVKHAKLLGRSLARLKRNDEAQKAFAEHKRLNESQTAQKEIDRRALVRRLADVRF